VKTFQRSQEWGLWVARHSQPTDAARQSSMLGRLVVVLSLGSAALAAVRGASRSDPPAAQRTDGYPPFPIGGPCTTAWREDMLTRVQELSGLKTWIEANPRKQTPSGNIPQAIANQLETARRTAAREDTRNGKRLSRWTKFWASVNGAAFERTLGNLDAVEVDLLRLAPDDYVNGQLPSLQAHVNRYLSKDDPRRRRVEELTLPGHQLTEADRDTLVAALHAANSHRRRELTRLRSFRNLIAGGALTLFALAALIAILGRNHPDWMPLCFLPEDKKKFVCPLHEFPVPNPTGAKIDDLVARTANPNDILVIELVGLVAATLAGAIALRSMRGTSTPYAVPVALILLKLPAGALTAVLGLLFIRGGFVPGLTALDSSAQIIAWAIIFGYAQQVFTRLIDNQGQGILHDVAGQGAAGDRPPKSR
jgi:hypothetical protein